VRHERRTARFGGARETDGHLRRVEIEIVADPHRREHAFGPEERVQPMRRCRRDLLHV
jgi:hypothetical protein